jgi:hypothetical protein
MPEYCACGFEMDKDVRHFLNCPKLKGSVTTRQHHRLVRVRAKALHKAGFTVTVEPRPPRSNKKKHRPDIIAYGGQHTHMSDTTRVNATAPSHIKDGQKAGRVAKYAENEKVREFQVTELAKSHDFNGDFMPIAYELHGTWGKGALKAAKKLYSAAFDFMSPATARDLSADYVRRIAVELQRGNAHLQRVGLDKARASRYHVMSTWCSCLSHNLAEHAPT